MADLRYFKHIVNGVVWSTIGLCALLFTLTHIPAVQEFVGAQVGEALSAKLGTKVKVGNVNLSLLNRIIVDDLLIYDQQHVKMFKSSRASVTIDLIPLLKGKISISSAQLFGMKAELYQWDNMKQPNYQFVIDSLASKDTTSHTPLDLRISSLIVRNGAVKYNHTDIRNISAHIMLDELTDSTLDMQVKRLSMEQQEGTRLNHLSFKLSADNKQATLSDFQLRLPHSSLSSDEIKATYETSDGKLIRPSLKFTGHINKSYITPSDIASFISELKAFNNPIHISSAFHGTGSSLSITNADLHSEDQSLKLHANGTISHWDDTPQWTATIQELHIGANMIRQTAEQLSNKVSIPDEVMRLGDISFTGEANGSGKDIAVRGTANTDAGDALLALAKNGEHLKAHVETDGLDIRQITDNQLFGSVAATIDIEGNEQLLKAKGTVSSFDYNGYTFQNIDIDGTYDQKIIAGRFSIDDPNARIDLEGGVRIGNQISPEDFTADIHYLNPQALRLLETADDYPLRKIHVEAGNQQGKQFMNINSDFASISVVGDYEYTTLVQSILNLVGSKLPTLPGLPKSRPTSTNNFSMSADIYSGEWLQKLFNIPVTITEPIHMSGFMSDRSQQMSFTCDLPRFSYDGNHFQGGFVSVSTPNDTLVAAAHIHKLNENGENTFLNVQMSAADNNLTTLLTYRSTGEMPVKGKLNIDTQFLKGEHNQDVAHIIIHPSEVSLGDSLWTIEPSDIVYRKNHIIIDHLAAYHNQQHIIISGFATPHAADSVFVDLKDVDVNYITNLVDFHSVEFSGKASGKAYAAAVLGKPKAAADLTVREFKFQDGRMGVLSAHVDYNDTKEQINIDAVANDGPGVQTLINGYVSPKRNFIDLAIKARNTRMEFLETFCSSFMRNVDAQAVGELRLAGDLKEINLTGDVTANGTLGIKPINCDYQLKDCHVHLVPDEIEFHGDTIRDKYGRTGIVTGAVHHKHLTRLSYDLNVKANNLLAFDTHPTNDDTFYGTVFATGNCAIHGKNGEVVIDVEATPEKGTQIVYDVASPDAIGNQEFISWVEHPDSSNLSAMHEKPQAVMTDIPTDIRMNFLFNTTQDLTLKLLMDHETGDYIALNGDGVLRASYYNKGAFDMFGTYNVDHGIYKLTIQNVIKKDFQFQPGSTIVFGGDPFNASLNLKAQYTVNGVSLSDLNIGRSFSNNNIRVNCLMNIGGYAYAPKVDFGLDMPTVNSDAKQMVYSLINSEEEMNQQVLYLLAIGRFYAQGANNAGIDGSNQQSQTSLAMQSFLSGTISQQINNVLSNVLKSNNWNFGANISTGDEGWNNAEYEGLLSGKLLNNRLLINGQFGYRDNENATTSFIGDFDIKYLLYPSGNMAIKVYNQTNDRYFTRNSLTTQGIGLVMKKDFNGLSDLLGTRKKSKKKSNKSIKEY